jgi:hypothetical protein
VNGILTYGKQRPKKNVNFEIGRRKFGWIGHTLRKDDREIPKAALQ